MLDTVNSYWQSAKKSMTSFFIFIFSLFVFVCMYVHVYVCMDTVSVTTIETNLTFLIFFDNLLH